MSQESLFVCAVSTEKDNSDLLPCPQNAGRSAIIIQTRQGSQSAVTGVKCALKTMDQSTHSIFYDTMSEKCALLCILFELLRAQTGFRPWKYVAEYRYLCLTYFLIDSFKNESFQHRLPFQKHLKATAHMHCFCSIECLLLAHCMKRCHLWLCMLTAPTFQCRSIFVLILRYKATVNSSLCRDKRGKKEMNQHSHISFGEEEEGSKIRFTHNSGKDNIGFVQLSPAQNNHFLILYEGQEEAWGSNHTSNQGTCQN